jgi:hypothetical protein
VGKLMDNLTRRALMKTTGASLAMLIHCSDALYQGTTLVGL